MDHTGAKAVRPGHRALVWFALPDSAGSAGRLAVSTMCNQEIYIHILVFPFHHPIPLSINHF